MAFITITPAPMVVLVLTPRKLNVLAKALHEYVIDNPTSQERDDAAALRDELMPEKGQECKS